MDNDLLSKSKLIDWLEEKIESYFLAYHNSYSDYDQGREASYHEVIESVRSGLFDPDPTPSPTIKPGDKKEEFFKGYEPLLNLYFRTEVSHD